MPIMVSDQLRRLGMNEERMRILEMVREGKITADEAVRLLEALKGGAGATSSSTSSTSSASSGESRWGGGEPFRGMGDEVVVAAYRTDHGARMPRLVVSVPRNAGRLSVETVGGGVEATGFSCPASLKTAGGSVRVRGHGQGRIELRTAGGGIDVEG